MKHKLLVVILLMVISSACAPDTKPDTGDDSSALIVTDGTREKNYLVVDLEALPTSESTFSDVTYVGVGLSSFLVDAGFNPEEIGAVKAVATDGYIVNYGPELFLREDVIVAYAHLDGPLTEEDGTFRMVLPGEEGKLNVRMLVELQVVP